MNDINNSIEVRSISFYKIHMFYSKLLLGTNGHNQWRSYLFIVVISIIIIVLTIVKSMRLWQWYIIVMIIR